MTSILNLLFTADTKDLDEAKEKLADLKDGFPSVGDAIKSFVSSIGDIPGPVGLAVAAFAGFGLAIGEMVKSTIEANAEMQELSEAVGIPVEQLTTLTTALAMNGIAADKSERALQTLAQRVGEALSNPAGKTADEFKRLGISQDELSKGDLNQILHDTAQGFSKYANNAQRVAAERDLLSRQGPEIVAALNSEGGSLSELAKTLSDYGVATASDDEAAKRLHGTIVLGNQVWAGLANQVTRNVIPGLQNLVTWFTNSAKEGGQLHDVIGMLVDAFSFVGKTLIDAVGVPIIYVVGLLKDIELGWVAAGAAIKAAASGNFKEAGAILVQMNKDMDAADQKTMTSIDSLKQAIFGVHDAAKKLSDDTTKPPLGGLDQNAQKLDNTLKGLEATLEGAVTESAAAAKSLDAYKAAQDEIAIATMKVKLAQDGANKSQIDNAEITMRATNAAKQTTDDEKAGWTMINQLTAENIGLTTHQTQLQRELADIASHPGMTAAEKQQATALAQTNEQLREQATLQKNLADLDKLAASSTAQEIAAMTKGTNELKLYNQELKLAEQLNKDMVGKTPQEMEQLAAAYQKNLALLQQNNQTTLTWTQSWAGLSAGAGQALQNIYTQGTNLNAMGNQLVNTFAHNLTTAFENLGSKGSEAWKTLGVQMLQFFDNLIIKWALAKVAMAAMEAMGMTPQEAGAIVAGGAGLTKSANGNAFNGGSVVAFADGGIIGGPTLAPMALMGEAGPEAVMPLQRNSQGQLGVSVSGTTSSGAQITNHNSTFVINSNQDPHEVAKQVKKQVNIASRLTDARIATQQRPGGLLAPRSQAFVR